MFKRNYSTEKKGRGDNASSIVIETGPLLASLRRVALPIALQSIIAASLSLVDQNLEQNLYINIYLLERH